MDLSGWRVVGSKMLIYSYIGLKFQIRMCVSIVGLQQRLGANSSIVFLDGCGRVKNEGSLKEACVVGQKK
jgi:hypothetical protein